jgi:Membrane bound beta barrel domain (DUF5777)
MDKTRRLKQLKKNIMKKYKNNTVSRLILRCCFVLVLLVFASTGAIVAQDSTSATVTKKAKPVKNTFGSSWIMDNQSVMVPMKGSLQMDIQHRFGIVNNGAKDLWGVFAPSNIRIGLGYAPINKLYVSSGITKEKMMIDFGAKYALLQQTTDNSMPVSLTYFGNMVIEARESDDYVNWVDRLSYFNQLILARKITEKFSAQVAPSLSWYNNVEAYVDSKGDIQPKMENMHLAISFAGRYKITEKSAITVGYDQPLTQHTTNNPHPNICFGFETTTSSHAFQVYAGNYYSIVPQANNMYNQNDFTKGQFLIGFNITRLWNY